MASIPWHLRDFTPGGLWKPSLQQAVESDGPGLRGLPALFSPAGHEAAPAGCHGHQELEPRGPFPDRHLCLGHSRGHHALPGRHLRHIEGCGLRGAMSFVEKSGVEHGWICQPRLAAVGALYVAS